VTPPVDFAVLVTMDRVVQYQQNLKAGAWRSLFSIPQAGRRYSEPWTALARAINEAAARGYTEFAIPYGNG